MSITRKSNHPKAYGNGHIFQLLCGHDYFNDGFGEDNMEGMREAWPILKDKVTAMMIERLTKDKITYLFERPWGFWQFENLPPRLKNESDKSFLIRNGLLTQEEKISLQSAKYQNS